VEEVDEAKANTALGLDIDWEVEIVVLVFRLLVNHCHQVVLVELDWDVLDHQGGEA
jgi:hypothetical protein